MDRLSEMLDKALGGSFSESIYDETRLSALETKFSRFLTGYSVSAKNLIIEKEKIKTLISDISHQTKTPIANISLYSQLLSEHDLSNESQICVNQLSQQAEKLKFLIEALVKISRLETGVITVVPKDNPIDELIGSVIEQIKMKADIKNISIDIERAGQNAFFDMKWTVEAIFNIVDNSVKYTPSCKTITIKTIPYELFYRIDIIDEGIGIAEHEQSMIFGRFYRSPSVNGQEGVGLGLFLAREIIAAEGGYIKVSSILGKGSTFSVFLPRQIAK